MSTARDDGPTFGLFLLVASLTSSSSLAHPFVATFPSRCLRFPRVIYLVVFLGLNIRIPKMAEKRRLSARDRREPAAKRRVSEANTPQPQSQPQQHASKKKASTPVVAATPPPPPPPEPVDPPLPTKIRDGEGLPMVAAPQPDDLPSTDYQSIAERYG